MQNPYPYYERLRAEDPCTSTRDPDLAGDRHADIMAVAANTEDYSTNACFRLDRSPFKAESTSTYCAKGSWCWIRRTVSRSMANCTRAAASWSRTLLRAGRTAMEARVAGICRDKAATFSRRARPTWSGNTPCPYPSSSSAMPWVYRGSSEPGATNGSQIGIGTRLRRLPRWPHVDAAAAFVAGIEEGASAGPPISLSLLVHAALLSMILGNPRHRR